MCGALDRGLALFDLEWGNIQAGQAWAAAHVEDDDMAAKLCSGYADVGLYCLNLRRHPQEVINRPEAAVSAARRLKDRRAEDAHLGDLGNADHNLGQVERAIEYYQQALYLVCFYGIFVLRFALSFLLDWPRTRAGRPGRRVRNHGHRATAGHGQRVWYRIHSPSINQAGFGSVIGQSVIALQAYILCFEMLAILPFSRHPPRPVLNRLGDVRRLDVLTARQICDRASQLARWALRLSAR